MRAFIDKIWAQLKEYYGKMSRGSKIRLAIFSVLVIVLAIILVAILSNTNYVTMYTAQDPAEAGNVAASLKEMGVPYRVDGLSILVPDDRVSEIRIELSRQGTLGPGPLDMGIMQGAEGFSVTDAHARRLYDRQLAEDIRAMILLSPSIQNAIVVVHQGETSPFRLQTGVKAPHIAVMLSVIGGGMLTNQEAQNMAKLITGAVPGIEYENIRISDTNLNTYKVGEDVVLDFDQVMESRIALQRIYSEQIQSQVEQLLTPIFGMSNIRVTPMVRLNFDKVVRESIEFAPPVAGELDGIARSAKDIWEAARRTDLAAGIPGTDTNGLGAIEYPYGTLDDNEIYARRVEERNYEINQTTEVIERAEGKIEFLSIAVAINEDATEDDYTEQVSNLVSRGLGILPANIAVESIPFSFVDTTLEDMIKAMDEAAAQQRQRELVQLIIQWAVILLLGIMLMLLIRTIFRAIHPPPEPELLLADGGLGIDYMADGEITDVTGLDEVEVQKPTGLEQIERFIERDPAAVAQLLRNWLSDE